MLLAGAQDAMNDVLDQSDIDALLNATDDTEEQQQQADVKIFSSNRRDLESVEVREYDFKRPERVSKDQMNALQTLHEAFARNFGAALSGFLRTIIEVKVSSCEQMTYSEFIAGLPNPTSFNLLSADQMDGQICLELSPLIIYPIIDRLLGGTNAELFIPQRPLTMIEGRLITRILERAVESLQEAWSSVRELTFEVAGGESNPHLVQIVPPNEVVVVVGCEIKMTTRAGTMNLCIPYAAIEPLMEDLAAQSWFSTSRLKSTPEYIEKMTGNVSAAPLMLSGLLAETEMTLSELVSLKEGDIIVTEREASMPMTIEVEGEPKLIAELGQHRGKRALKVIRARDSTDR